MKKLKAPALKLDERPIGSVVVTYLRHGDSWFVEVAVYTGEFDTPMVREWPVDRGVVHYSQLDDIGLWIGTAVSDAIQRLLPVKGVAPGT